MKEIRKERGTCENEGITYESKKDLYYRGANDDFRGIIVSGRE